MYKQVFKSATSRFQKSFAMFGSMKKILRLLILSAFCITHLAQAQNPATFNITYNTGFTPQAQTAFAYAANIWTQTLESTVPIKVNAYFVTLVPGLLGITFPNGVKDFPGAPVSSTWYATSLANSITGTELNPGQFDVDLYLNSSINWYTDTVGTVPAGQYDLVSIVLHELCHGLGFVSLAKKSGTVGSLGLLQASGFAPLVTSFPWPNLDTLPGIFDHYLLNALGQPLDTFANPSSALGAQLTSNNVYFSGPSAVSANGNINPRMYAPATFSLGSSILHLNEATYPVGNINELMTPNAAPGSSNHNPGPICIGILQDIGWTINPYLGISENNDERNNVVVYPNPARGQFTIYDPPAGRAGLRFTVSRFEVLDVLGQRILSKKPTASNKRQITIDVSDFNPGIYFLKLTGENISVTKKIVVQ